MNELGLRLSRIRGELLVAARHGDGASLGTHRLGHAAVGTPVVRNQHVRVAVVRAAGRVVEARARTVGAHRTAGGHAAAVPSDDLWCWVSARLRWVGLAQTPGAAHIVRQVKRLVVLHVVPGQVRHARCSVRSPDSPPPPVISLLEHVIKRGVQHPEVALPVPCAFSGHFNEAFIERQVVSDAVLPTFLILLIVGEPGDDVVINPAQGLSLVVAVSDGHGDESHVGIRWLLQAAAVLPTLGFRGGRVWANVQELHSLVGVCVHRLRLCVLLGAKKPQYAA